jgi:hypothetical protein
MGLEIDAEQGGHIRRIFELVARGKSMRRVAEILSAETGRPWRPTVADRLVRREIYKQAQPGRIANPRRWNAARDALAARRKGPLAEPAHKR